MPARVSADRNEILRVFMETKNGAETARRLGLHNNTVYQILRSARGQCRQCARLAQPGAQYCGPCLKTIRERAKAKRKKRRRAGVCAQCDRPTSPPSRTYCADHRIAHLESAERGYYRRKARGGVTSEIQRRNHIKSKYGHHGLDVWNESGATCVACGRHHGEQVVHIHHLDGNNQNNARENLTCLCFDCHMLTERLLSHHDLGALFRWFASMYPSGLP